MAGIREIQSTLVIGILDSNSGVILRGIYVGRLIVLEENIAVRPIAEFKNCLKDCRSRVGKTTAVGNPSTVE